MKLNTKVRYGARAMLELAQWYGQGPIRLGEIAQSQALSEKYLEALLSRLRSAGLLVAQRGPQGGYALARPPEQINLREIFDVLESAEPYASCTNAPNGCDRWATCVTREVWAEMYQASMHVLESTTLADLMARNEQRTDASATYSI
jgi:Rrf2 family cysteine metabolism transcriptional repressor